MKEKIILCRRVESDFGQAVRYCAKPIKKQNLMNWCAKHYARVPFWPTEK